MRVREQILTILIVYYFVVVVIDSYYDIYGKELEKDEYFGKWMIW